MHVCVYVYDAGVGVVATGWPEPYIHALVSACVQGAGGHTHNTTHCVVWDWPTSTPRMPRRRCVMILLMAVRWQLSALR
jgi:hypothetical protein